jgi:flagella synthesis protein FlgN
MKEHQLPLSAQCLDTDNLQALRPLWQQVEAQYQANQRLSTKLSQIVLGVRLRTEQKLKILLGRQNEPYLYNQQGGTNHLHSSHGYAQA